MASNKEYLDFILEQLSELEGITFRPMMGEYILYMHGKIIGGIYDDRFLVKPTKSAAAFKSDSSGFPLCTPLNSPLQWNSRSSIGIPALSATALTFL